MANTPEQTRQAVAMQAIALTVLTARAGGVIEIPTPEFEEVVERYGGKGNATLFAERLEGGGPDRIRITLVNKKPAQGDLMV
jgi:hypothetical protein